MTGVVIVWNLLTKKGFWLYFFYEISILRMLRIFLHDDVIKNVNSIAKELTEQGIPSSIGKEKWYYGTIHQMLQNEKYKGDSLLLKKFYDQLPS